MSEGRKPKNETEEVFAEYFAALEKADQVKANPDLPQRAMLMEYMELAEKFEQLLKTSVRIAKLGDKAQKKLMKYKELLDTLRNIE